MTGFNATIGKYECEMAYEVIDIDTPLESKLHAEKESVAEVSVGKVAQDAVAVAEEETKCDDQPTTYEQQPAHDNSQQPVYGGDDQQPPAYDDYNQQQQ